MEESQARYLLNILGFPGLVCASFSTHWRHSLHRYLFLRGQVAKCWAALARRSASTRGGEKDLGIISLSTYLRVVVDHLLLTRKDGDPRIKLLGVKEP